MSEKRRQSGSVLQAKNSAERSRGGKGPETLPRRGHGDPSRDSPRPRVPRSGGNRTQIRSQPQRPLLAAPSPPAPAPTQDHFLREPVPALPRQPPQTSSCSQHGLGRPRRCLRDEAFPQVPARKHAGPRTDPSSTSIVVVSPQPRREGIFPTDF